MHYIGNADWKQLHRRWLARFSFAESWSQMAFQEHRRAIEDRPAQCQRLEQLLRQEALRWRLFPVVQALQALRGVQFIVAVGLAAEIGDMNRFDNPRKLMDRIGLVAVGAKVGLRQITSAIEQIPGSLRQALQGLLEEVRELERRIGQIEQQLTELARHSEPCLRLLSVPGIGLLTATAMAAATGGSVSHFKSARHFAAWFGLTPKEHSSGGSRHLGRISKRGDRYLRMLLTHGARSVLNAAALARRRQKPVDPLRVWALGLAQRSHHNKATCALANKLARICYAVLRDQEPYAARTVFANAA